MGEKYLIIEKQFHKKLIFNTRLKINPLLIAFSGQGMVGNKDKIIFLLSHVLLLKISQSLCSILAGYNGGTLSGGKTYEFL